eukprot:354208-Chlamydomonas_euryale.AAC.15
MPTRLCARHAAQNQILLPGGTREGLTLRGYKDICFLRRNGKYVPVHILSHDKLCNEIKPGQTHANPLPWVPPPLSMPPPSNKRQKKGQPDGDVA